MKQILVNSMAWKARIIARLDSYIVIRTNNIYLNEVLAYLKRLRDSGVPILPILTSGTMSKLKKVAKLG